MGVLTHHITDANVHDNKDGTAAVWSLLDDGVLMDVTQSGYLQPPVSQRANRFLLAIIVGFFTLWLRWVISDTMDIDTFFDFGTTHRYPSLNTTLTFMGIGVWFSAAHILIFQRAYIFGDFPGWHFFNSLMMAIYFFVVGAFTIVYIGMMVVTILQWISRLLSNDR